MTTRRDFLIAGSAAAAMLSLPGCTQAAVRPATDKALRILVLGGTGFLGPHFVEAARANGHQLTLFNRGKSNPTRFSGGSSTTSNNAGRPQDRSSALQGGRGWDAVLDTSAYSPTTWIARPDCWPGASVIRHHFSIPFTPQQYAGRRQSLKWR